MYVSAGATEGVHATALEKSGQLLLLGLVLLAVAIVPLLIDVGSLDDTYYAPKARALSILSPMLLAAVIFAGGGTEVRRARMLWPWLAFAAIAVIATGLSVNPVWSLQGAPQRHEGLLSLLAYPAIGAATLVVVARGGWRFWCTAALAAATVVAAYGVAQYFGWDWLIRDSIRMDWWRPFSTSGNPNFLGAYMVLMSPLAVSALLTARRRTALVLAASSLGLIVLAALCTYSRAAWLGGAVAAGLFAVVFRSRWSADPRPTAMTPRAFAAVALVGFVAGVFFIPSSPLGIGRADWSAARRAQTVIEPGDPQAGFRQRSYLWSQTIVLVGRRPLFGYGPEAFVRVFPQAWDEQRAELFGPSPLRIDKAHNETLDMAMSMGLLGVAAYAWVLARTLRNAQKTWDLTTPPTPVLAAACVAAMTGYWVDVQWHFSVVSVAPVFWSMLGATNGLAVRSMRGTP